MRSIPLHRHTAIVPLVVAALALTACDRSEQPDASGNFEAEEVVVSAQTSGQLEQFAVVEGASLTVGDTTARIDTAQLALERRQLEAQRGVLAVQRQEAARQLESIAAQREIAQRVQERATRLFSANAATATQRDQAERDARVTAAQWSAAKLATARLDAERAVLDTRTAAVTDRLQRATVRNPVAGTVLATYVRAGEIVQPGQPLYRVASLDTLTLRAYLSGAQLARVRLGQAITVHTDGEGGLRAHTGTVSWIAARAEFTPTPVQTRDERTDLVYAIKVRVPNPDGALKIGMPADVALPPARVATNP